MKLLRSIFLLSWPGARSGFEDSAPTLSRLIWLLLVGALPLALACESEELGPGTPTAVDQIYWGLELDHHAVMLSTVAPYETLALVATPINYAGAPLVGLPAPTYRSADVGKVQVTSAGLLVARARTTQPVMVVSELTVGNLRHADTVMVKVDTVSAPLGLNDLSIQPVPPDSAKIPSKNAFISKTITARVFDTLGNMVTGLPVHFRSSNPSVALIDKTTGVVTAIEAGNVNFYASTTAFGVTKADTVSYRITPPLALKINIFTQGGKAGSGVGALPWGTIGSPKLIIAVGGTVAWGYAPLFDPDIPGGFPWGPVFDITFDEVDLPKVTAANPAEPWVNGLFDPLFSYDFYCNLLRSADCGAGNARIGGGTEGGFVYAVRRFPVVGTYNYRSTMWGTSGQIIVVPE